MSYSHRRRRPKLTHIKVRDRTATPLKTASPKHCRVLPGLLVRGEHIRCARTLRKWIPCRRAEETQVFHDARNPPIPHTNLWGHQISPSPKYCAPRSEDRQSILGP